ncbi:MAG: DUF5615 family PIN-like protein [Gemmatimonadetes bacterium]|nr:DUF5615 family PIN-like protein [Gemmatimonadota bacterium]
MRLYLDEMISPKIAAALREQGHDVVAAAERGGLGATQKPGCVSEGRLTERRLAWRPRVSLARRKAQLG